MTSQSQPGERSFGMLFLLGALGSHVVLALLMKVDARLAAAHAVATLLVGAWWAAIDRTPQRAICAAGYLAACEVLWRMSRAPIFWEFAKYGLILIFAILVLRRRGGLRAHGGLPLLYLGLLLPGAILTLVLLGPTEEARQHLAFNMGGPVALALGFLALCGRHPSARDVERVLLALLCPAIAVYALALYGVLTRDAIEFSQQSNFATSGGYGPNQVSATLSLGMLACFLLYLRLPASKRRLRAALLVVALAISIQDLLTFSRGGLFNFALAVCGGGALHLRESRARFAFLTTSALVILTVSLVVLPRVDRFTGGAFKERYTDLSTTGRSDFIRADFQLFLEKPLLGVGVGRAKQERERLLGREVATHTEFSRLFSEHGVLGLLALLVLVWILARAFRRGAPAKKVWIACLALWCCGEFFHSAWRLAVVSFLLSLALLEVDPEATEPQLEAPA